MVALRSAGFDARGEVPGEIYYQGACRNIRADILIFDNTATPQIIVEVKTSKKYGPKISKKREEREREQRDQYRACGMPLVYCHGVTQIGPVVGWVTSTAEHLPEDFQ